MPSVPQISAPVGKSGPASSRAARRACTRVRRATSTSASTSSRRLCGGTFVAMPTAMPAEPLTSRFGKRVGSTDGSLVRAVEVRHEVDRLAVDVAQHLLGDRARAGSRCSGRRPADRRRSSRSCPGRRSADSAARSPGPCARARRRPRSRRAGGSASAPRRRRRRTSSRRASGAVPPAASRRGCGGGPASGRRARRAARG